MKSQSTHQSRAEKGSSAHPNVYASILWNSENIAIARLTLDWHIMDANSAFKLVTGVENPVGKSIVDLIAADDAAGWLQQSEKMRVAPVLLNYVRADGDVTSLHSRLYATEEEFELLVGEVPIGDLIAAEGVMTTLNNEVTTLARENARNSKILKQKSEELRVALHELDTTYWHLKKIQEFLPICVYCHKVKSTADHWEHLAEYLKKNSLFLSHGLCPECAPLFAQSNLKP